MQEHLLLDLRALKQCGPAHHLPLGELLQVLMEGLLLLRRLSSLRQWRVQKQQMPALFVVHLLGLQKVQNGHPCLWRILDLNV